jgi:hypothetical protein
MVAALALLLCAPMAMAQGRVTIQGHVTSMVADGSGFRVTLDSAGNSYWIASATVSDRNLRLGDYVRFDGYGNGSLITVDNATWLGDRSYSPNGDRSYSPNGDRSNSQYGDRSSSPYNGRPMYSNGGPEQMSGVVQNVNRHYNYLTLRMEGTGRQVRVDLRQMDTRESINVWRLRPGDRVNVTGGWAERGRFQADRVFF